ncbi:MAG: hypothetical protein HLUCCA11_15030 [Phormidesmis priestleyi Ana]|uniref:Uncharacterized protein n=1 Tax=Phormidesmis priestleyi Ana TaxID=1666911 RepID=A0A0P8BZT0_9CYAN|nr:MAG: hypothetical protein HLUCCA11_15030 [Phormidesmis priestleyi Ana]
MPKRSFYYYFRSKEDFELAVMEEFAAEHEGKLQQIFEEAQLILMGEEGAMLKTTAARSV